MEKITLTPCASLGEVDPERIVAFNIGADGLLYILLAIKPLDYRCGAQPDQANFPKIHPESAQSYDLYRLEHGELRLISTIRDEKFNIHHIQPLGSDRLLLACARCQRHADETADENGRIYRLDGTFIRGITLGDGIQNLSVNPDGLIWASYFDEGIFGNFGWKDPLGSAGLVAWKEDGTKAYEFEPDENLGPMADCYATNADGDDLWIYYYTDFPLVRIRDFTVRQYWEVPIEGAGELAVAGNQILLFGSYEDRNLHHLLELGQSREASPRHQFTLHDESGGLIVAQRVAGRGNTIFLMRGREIFRITVEAAKDALP